MSQDYQCKISKTIFSRKICDHCIVWFWDDEVDEPEGGEESKFEGPLNENRTPKAKKKDNQSQASSRNLQQNAKKTGKVPLKSPSVLLVKSLSQEKVILKK